MTYNVMMISLSVLFVRSLLQTFSPTDTFNATWLPPSSSSSSQPLLLLDWTALFSPTSGVQSYEVSLGPQLGSGALLAWLQLDTQQTSLTVADTRLSSETDYFVSLIAVGRSGLHTSVYRLVAGTPV